MKSLLAVLSVAVAAPAAASSRAEPFDVFEYRNVGPNRGGRVTAVAGTVAAPGTFYLGASGGGVWKTADFGTTWNPVSDGYFASPSIGDIAVAQNDANVIYVGTGSDGLRSNVIAGKGMYKSIDGGDTWHSVGLENTGHIGAVEIDPTNHNIVWVAAIGQAYSANEERGVYKTTDGGASWNKVLYRSDRVGFADIELLPGNPEIVFATAWKAQRTPWTIISGGSAEDEGGIYKSADGGASWKKINAGLPGKLIGKIDLAVSPADSSIVYALVEAPDDDGGLYKSVDQGNTFTQVSSEKGIRTRPFYYTNIDVDPKNPDIVYAMATGYFKSADGGVTWQRIDSPHGDNHDMWIDPENPELFIQSNDGGANVTHNGGKTWSTQFNQATAELYQVEVDDQYPFWLYGGQQDNSTTIAVPSQAPYGVQHPASWIVASGGCETGPAVPKPGNHHIVYANCKGRFGVYDKRIGTERSYYVGAANMYGHNPRDLRYRFQRVSPIHVSPHDPGVVYHASQYVHRTRDEGATWETISPDLTAFERERQVISGAPITRDITGEEFYSTIYALRESPVEAGVIWVGANDGPVHVTRNNGESWEEVTPSGLPPGGRVDAVEPSPHDAAKAYIAVLRHQLGDWKPYIYRTANFGSRWRLLTNGRNGIPSDVPTRVVREDPEREGLLYAGTESGVFVSLDDGETWRPFQQNLPVTPVTDIKVQRGSLAVSTMGRSFWVLDNITTLRQPAFDTLSDGVTLFRPPDSYRYRLSYADGEHTVPDYPVPAVVIDYYLPEDEAGTARLEIRDADDRLVTSYVAGVDDEEGDGQRGHAGDARDMSSEETRPAALARLSGEAGMHRFRWDMRHCGPWHEDEKRRFTDGPMAQPGRYTLSLTAGSTTVSQPLMLRTDPRVLDAGTTVADIAAQVGLQLRVVSLLSDARQLVHALETERDELTEKADKAAPGKAAAARLETIAAALQRLETDDDVIYPEPKLSSQIAYLYDMLGGADQAPGNDAVERFSELQHRFDEVRTEVAD